MQEQIKGSPDVDTDRPTALASTLRLARGPSSEGSR